MTKIQTIEDAQEKANLTRQLQTVFRYLDGVNVRFDYTHSSLWGRRQYRQPIATEVTTVKPAITNIN